MRERSEDSACVAMLSDDIEVARERIEKVRGDVRGRVGKLWRGFDGTKRRWVLLGMMGGASWATGYSVSVERRRTRRTGARQIGQRRVAERRRQERQQ